MTEKRQQVSTGRKTPPYVHHPMGREQIAQRKKIHLILRSTDIKTKLTVGPPYDKYQQEVDCITEQVMGMPDISAENLAVGKEKNESKSAVCESGGAPCSKCTNKEDDKIRFKPPGSGIKPLIQREPLSDEELEQDGEENILQAKKVSGNVPQVTPQVETNINALRGGGKPLSKATRRFFEPRFGLDFNKVRIHIGQQAQKTAKDINSSACTIGQDIVFGIGQYSPETISGKRLLAHELEHVVQQRNNNYIIQRQQSRQKIKRYYPSVNKFLRQIPLPQTGVEDIPDSQIEETQEFRDLIDPYLKWQWHENYKGEVTKRVALLACRIMIKYRKDTGRKINWKTEASRFVTQAISEIEKKDIEETAELRRELFVVDLPNAIISEMELMGWQEGADLMGIWKDRKSAIAPNYSKSVVNLIKMDWVLKFGRAKLVYDKILKERIWTNTASLNRIANFQKGKPQKTGRRVGDLSKPVTEVNKEWINSRPVGSKWDYDALAGALGRFEFHVAITGNQILINGELYINIGEVGIYVWDSFDFNGSQFLGFWGKLADEPVNNADFREWRAQNGMGGDFLIYSDIKRIKLNPPEIVKVPK